jgi:hypothetical protein
MIPRRLIQTSRSSNLSPFGRGCATNLKLLHPDWDYVFFDDQSIRKFITEEFPHHLNTFESFRFNIQRIDFFRYLAVYRLGGFYFDTDVLLSESLIPLLDHQCVFPFEELTLNFHLRRNHGLDWELGNYAFGAAPGDPFLAAVIENCVRGQKDQDWVAPMMQGIPSLFQNDLYVLNTTGPGLLTRTLAENPSAARQMTVLFPQDVCDPSTWHLFGDYGIHLMDGSWRTKGNLIKRRLARYWESRVRRVQLNMSKSLGPTRSLRGSQPSPALQTQR